MRIEKLRKKLKELDVEAILLSDAYNVRYYTGYSGGDGFVLVTIDKVIILTDSRYVEQVAKESPSCLCYDIGRNTYAVVISKLLKEKEIHRLGFEDNSIGYKEYEGLKNQCVDIIFVEASDSIDSFRKIKDSNEIEYIRQAEAIGDGAFSHISSIIKVGMSEREIALEIEFYMKKSGADGLSFDTIVASGPNSSMPHAKVSDRKIVSGDFITMDFGCIYKGYCSDMTRTVAVGECSSKQGEIYDIVLEAQEEALSMLKPGMKCCDVDFVARDIIREAGYDKYFGHGLGHSVGLYIHESPRLSPTCSEILEPGMIMTVEPGIYLPGEFGVRIEDLVVITENGYENLTNSDKILTVF